MLPFSSAMPKGKIVPLSLIDDSGEGFSQYQANGIENRELAKQQRKQSIMEQEASGAAKAAQELIQPRAAAEVPKVLSVKEFVDDRRSAPKVKGLGDRIDELRNGDGA